MLGAPGRPTPDAGQFEFGEPVAVAVADVVGDHGEKAEVGTGAQIVQVQPNGPAAGAGLRPGDVITAVGSRAVTSSTELTAAIRLAGGFAVVASYGDFDADTPVEAVDAWRMILVLRRE